MSITFIDGFSTYGAIDKVYQNGWTPTGSNPAALTTGRFAGSSAITFDGIQRGVRRSFGQGAVTEYCIGFAHRVNSSDSNSIRVLNLFGETIPRYILRILPEGVLEVLYNSNLSSSQILLETLSLGSGSAVVNTVGAWNYIEFRVFDGTSFQVFVNGVLDFGGTLPDSVNLFSFGFGYDPVFQNNGSQRNRVTDLYVKIAGGIYNADTLPLGDCRVDVKVPEEDVTTQFIPSAGTTNYENVDEREQDGDATFVSAANTGDFDAYRSTTPLPYNPQKIHAVQVGVVARKSDAGLRRSGIRVQSAGGTVVTYPGVSLGTEYQRTNEVLEVDPDGNIEWSKPKVDALIFGPRIEV
jgi:hypothetical protein